MKKILIVDDSDYIRSLLKDILGSIPNSDQFESLEALNGIDALEVFKKENPDLVLLDILMPEMDGIQVFKKMKEINSDVKILIISALDENVIVPRLGKYSVDGYITKPFDSGSLIDQINKILAV